MCNRRVKKLFKNPQPFGKKCQKTAGAFFDSHCTYYSSMLLCVLVFVRVCMCTGHALPDLYKWW